MRTIDYQHLVFTTSVGVNDLYEQLARNEFRPGDRLAFRVTPKDVMTVVKDTVERYLPFGQFPITHFLEDFPEALREFAHGGGGTLEDSIRHSVKEIAARRVYKEFEPALVAGYDNYSVNSFTDTLQRAATAFMNETGIDYRDVDDTIEKYQEDPSHNNFKVLAHEAFSLSEAINARLPQFSERSKAVFRPLSRELEEAAGYGELVQARLIAVSKLELTAAI